MWMKIQIKRRASELDKIKLRFSLIKYSLKYFEQNVILGAQEWMIYSKLQSLQSFCQNNITDYYNRYLNLNGNP